VKHVAKHSRKYHQCRSSEKQEFETKTVIGSSNITTVFTDRKQQKVASKTENRRRAVDLRAKTVKLVGMGG
jgi:hypothetical protein